MENKGNHTTDNPLLQLLSTLSSATQWLTWTSTGKNSRDLHWSMAPLTATDTVQRSQA